LNSRIAAERTRLADRAGRLGPGLQRGLAGHGDRFRSVAGRLRAGPLRDRIARGQGDLDRLGPRLHTTYWMKMTKLAEKLDALERMRRTLGYEATLARGYAVVRDSAQAVVTEAEAARGRALEIEFQDGRVQVQAEGTKARVKTRPGKPDQGSLF